MGYSCQLFVALQRMAAWFRATSLYLSLPLLLSLSSSCSSLDSTALNATARLVHKGSIDLLREPSWELFKESLPGQIKLLEALLSQDPQNTDLLATLVRAHSGLAFGVYETLDLEIRLQKKEGPWKELALYHYQRSLILGAQLLNQKGVSFKDLLESTRHPTGTQGYLESVWGKRVSSEFLEDLFFLANAWANAINLNKSDIPTVATLPVVKGLFDYVCAQSPELHSGACLLFNALYEGGRPQMLGGNPAKAEAFFIDGAKKYPENLLIPQMHLQYGLIPQGDKKSVDSMLAELKKKRQSFLLQLKPYAFFGEQPVRTELNLFNAIASKRIEILARFSQNLTQ